MRNRLQRIFGGSEPNTEVEENPKVEEEENETEATEDVAEEAAETDETEDDTSSPDDGEDDKESDDPRVQERKRIHNILTCEAANGKNKSAMHLAFNTSLSAEDAIEVLAGVEVPNNTSKLNQRMNAQNTKVGADSDLIQEEKTQSLAERKVSKAQVKDTSLAGRMKLKKGKR